MVEFIFNREARVFSLEFSEIFRAPLFKDTFRRPLMKRLKIQDIWQKYNTSFVLDLMQIVDLEDTSELHKSENLRKKTFVLDHV